MLRVELFFVKKPCLLQLEKVAYPGDKIDCGDFAQVVCQEEMSVCYQFQETGEPFGWSAGKHFWLILLHFKVPAGSVKRAASRMVAVPRQLPPGAPARKVMPLAQFSKRTRLGAALGELAGPSRRPPMEQLCLTPRACASPSAKLAPVVLAALANSLTVRYLTNIFSFVSLSVRVADAPMVMSGYSRCALRLIIFKT